MEEVDLCSASYSEELQGGVEEGVGMMPIGFEKEGKSPEEVQIVEH